MSSVGNISHQQATCWIILIFILSHAMRHTLAERPMRVQFQIMENQPKGTLLGNVRLAYERQQQSIHSDGASPQFNHTAASTISPIGIVRQDMSQAHLFKIDRDSGNVMTAGNIDRESICSSVASQSAFTFGRSTSREERPAQPSVGESECLVYFILSLEDVFIEFEILILDENDCSPEFPESKTTVSISESSPIGSTFPLPSAKDLDSPKFGLRGYCLRDSDKPSGNQLSKTNVSKITQFFEVLNVTNGNRPLPSLRLIRPLDWEMQRSFSGYLEATDGGGRKGRLDLLVTVIDVNEHPPQWRRVPYYKRVRECTNERLLFPLLAEDQDDPSTPNGQVDYRVSSHSMDYTQIIGLFYISGDQLNVYYQNLAATLGGQRTSMEFYVTAVDGRGLSSDTLVKIDIEDCNDHAPEIQVKNQSAAVWENDGKASVLTLILVRDDDRGTNSDFVCHLTSNSRMMNLVEASASRDIVSTYDSKKSSQYLFDAGPRWAIYRLETQPQAIFDREESDQVVVVIQCSDRGVPSLSTNQAIRVTVRDCNDNAPVFQREPYLFSIMENLPPGTFLGSVVASDRDAGKNAQITFRLVFGGAQDLMDSQLVPFSISPRGDIHTLLSFDREKMDQLEFFVEVSDLGDPPLSSSVLVRVRILDQNDNTPEFQSSYIFTVVESHGNTPIHRYFGRVNATDLDLGYNASVFYRVVRITTSSYNDMDASVSASALAALTISPMEDPNSRSRSQLVDVSYDGRLNVHGVIDRERMSSIYVDIFAYDRGFPPLYSMTTVTIHVLDLNDNKPTFRLPSPSLSSNGGVFNVSLSAAVGTMVCQLEADDPDSAENGTLTFTLMQPVTKVIAEVFQLHTDGRLILKQKLSNYQQATKSLQTMVIKVSDQGPGGTALSDYTTMKIRFIDDLLDKTGNKKEDNSLSDRIQQEPIWKNGDLTLIYYLAAGLLALLLLCLAAALTGLYIKGRHWRSWTSRSGRQDSNKLDFSVMRYSPTMMTVARVQSATPFSVKSRTMDSSLEQQHNNDHAGISCSDDELAALNSPRQTSAGMGVGGRSSSTMPYPTAAAIAVYNEYNNAYTHLTLKDNNHPGRSNMVQLSGGFGLGPGVYCYEGHYTPYIGHQRRSEQNLLDSLQMQANNSKSEETLTKRDACKQEQGDSRKSTSAQKSSSTGSSFGHPPTTLLSHSNTQTQHAFANPTTHDTSSQLSAGGGGAGGEDRVSSTIDSNSHLYSVQHSLLQVIGETSCLSEDASKTDTMRGGSPATVKATNPYVTSTFV